MRDSAVGLPIEDLYGVDYYLCRGSNEQTKMSTTYALEACSLIPIFLFGKGGRVITTP